jgi:hypothetical protein
MEKIEQEVDQSRSVAAVRGELDDIKRGDAVGSHTAQFAIEIGLARIESGYGLSDRGILVGSVEPGAR